MHSLLFLEPGHFHAALTLRARNPRVDRAIHLYARPGPERDAFIALVRSFNARGVEPTDWKLHVDDSDSPERTLVDERRGNVVVLAGRNQSKLGTVARLHAAGLHVLADKPWLTDPAALAALAQVTAGWPLAMDIMTYRHDTTSRLMHRLVDSPELFGELDRSSREPAVDLHSVHHLLKMVNGAPLTRPSWYYDVEVQGNGLVDIQSHMTDQAQWIVGDGAGLDLGRDCTLEGARLWDTPVPLDLFRASTGLDDFPATLAGRVEDEVLALACNGEIRYRLRGVPVRQKAEWGQREPDGGGDAYRATVRGTQAVIVTVRGPETGFRPELHIAPRRPGRGGFDARLDETLATWARDFPGLSRRTSGHGHEIVIPAGLLTPHEAHFPMVLDEFLDVLDANEWPTALAARIRARYTLLAKAHEAGAQVRSPPPADGS